MTAVVADQAVPVSEVVKVMAIGLSFVVAAIAVGALAFLLTKGRRS